MRVSAVRALCVTAVSLCEPCILRAPEDGSGWGMRSALVKPKIPLIISGIREYRAAANLAVAPNNNSASPWTQASTIFFRSGLGANGNAGQGITYGEPGIFFFVLAGEVGVARAAGAHQAGANGGDADAVFSQLHAQALAEADQ